MSNPAIWSSRAALRPAKPAQMMTRGVMDMVFLLSSGWWVRVPAGYWRCGRFQICAAEEFTPDGAENTGAKNDAGHDEDKRAVGGYHEVEVPEDQECNQAEGEC